MAICRVLAEGKHTFCYISWFTPRSIELCFRCGQKETEQGRACIPGNSKNTGGQACAIPTVGAPAATIHMAEPPRGTRAAREKSQCSVPKFRKVHPRGSGRYKRHSPGREICRPQTRPAKSIIPIQIFLVYLYAPRLGPADCPAESRTVRARKPAGAYARPRAARTLGGLFRLFCPHRGPVLSLNCKGNPFT